VIRKTEAFLEIETPAFVARARPDADLQLGDRAALSIRPEHVILLRRDRPHSEELETVLDVEIEDELATGNTHRLYLRVMNGTVATDCVLEADVSAHPYAVMGIASRRDWKVALTLDETVAIRES
jgi:hypothetical protein